MKNALTFCVLFCTFLFCATPQAQAEFTVTSAKKDQVMTGYTRPSRSVVLTAEVAGKVIRVNYKTGEATADRPIVEIDSTFVALSLENSQLQLKQIQSKIKSMESQVDFLRSAHERVSELRKSQNVSEVKFDESANNLTQAVNELDALKLEKERLRIAHKQLKEQLARHRIYGFRGGVITGLPVEAGEAVQPGSPVAEVSDYGTLVVPLAVSNEELSAFRNLPALFDATLDGIPVKARINFVNPRFDEKTRKLQMEIAIREFSGLRRGGLKFQTHLNVSTDGVLIPRQAVKNRFGNPSVTLKATRETVPVMILGETGNNLIVAETKKVRPGVILIQAQNP